MIERSLWATFSRSSARSLTFSRLSHSPALPPSSPPLSPRSTELKNHNLTGEMIIVDDNSRDGSEEKVKELAQQYPIRIIVRTTERGLSSAVLRGFQEAKYGVLVCMDADLQHDPVYLPAVVGPIIADSADFTVGSRHVGGGEIENWPLHRKIISWGATLVARPLVACNDPMSGFFSLRKTTLARAKTLNPLGYKVRVLVLARVLRWIGGCRVFFRFSPNCNSLVSLSLVSRMLPPHPSRRSGSS